MEDPRNLARRNLALFWLVVIGLPILLVWACMSLGIGPSQMS